MHYQRQSKQWTITKQFMATVLIISCTFYVTLYVMVVLMLDDIQLAGSQNLYHTEQDQYTLKRTLLQTKFSAVFDSVQQEVQNGHRLVHGQIQIQRGPSPINIQSIPSYSYDQVPPQYFNSSLWTTPQQQFIKQKYGQTRVSPLCSSIQSNYVNASPASQALIDQSSILDDLLLHLALSNQGYAYRYNIYLLAEQQITRRTYPAQNINTDFDALLDPQQNNFFQIMRKLSMDTEQIQYHNELTNMSLIYSQQSYIVGPTTDPLSQQPVFSYNSALILDGLFSGVIQVEVLPTYFSYTFQNNSPFVSNSVTLFTSLGGILAHYDPQNLLWNAHSISSCYVHNYTSQLGIEADLHEYFFNSSSPHTRLVFSQDTQQVQHRMPIQQVYQTKQQYGMDLVLLQMLQEQELHREGDELVRSIGHFNNYIVFKICVQIILCMTLSYCMAYCATMLVQKPLKRIMQASLFLSSEITTADTTPQQSNAIDTLLNYHSSDQFLQQMIQTVQSFLIWLLNREESPSRDMTILRQQECYMINQHQPAFQSIFISAPRQIQQDDIDQAHDSEHSLPWLAP